MILLNLSLKFTKFQSSESLKLPKMTFLDRLNLPKNDITLNLSGGEMIKFQQSQALTSHFKSFWSTVHMDYLRNCIWVLKIVYYLQVHNAEQLSDWCLSYLSQNYNSICRKFPKVLRGLHPENQAALNVNRWPPIW